MTPERERRFAALRIRSTAAGPRSRGLCACLVAAIAAGVVGCGPATAPRPNIVLVTIDTLRADRLSSYGYERKTTPFIDGLARRGLRFERAYSSTSWTAPAVVSILTSLPPVVHGVEHGFLRHGEIVQQEIIPDEARVWPELLREAGYRTFGITANGHLESRLGFARGFDRYTCLGFEDATDIEARVGEWAEEIRASEPWFLWLHFFDPHAPYRFHAEFTPEFTPRRQRFAKIEREPVAEFLKKHGVRFGNARYRYMRGLYDGEIRRTDAVLERIFDALGVDDTHLVIVTSDHGEEFLDHGRIGHGNTLFEEVIRVPLVMTLPGAEIEGRSLSEPVSVMDLLPTVLDRLRIAAPPGLHGRSLLAGRDGAGSPRDIVTTLSRLPGLETRSLTQGPWKYVHRWVEPEFRALYDLRNDPGEKKDLSASEASRASAMAERLAEIVAAAERSALEAGTQTIPDERLDELESLGYVQ